MTKSKSYSPRPNRLLFGAVLVAVGFTKLSVAQNEVSPVISIRLEEAQITEGIAFSFEKPEGYDSILQFSDDLSYWAFSSRFWTGDGNRERVAFSGETNRRLYRLIVHPVPTEAWVTAKANTDRAEYRIFQSSSVTYQSDPHTGSKLKICMASSMLR